MSTFYTSLLFVCSLLTTFLTAKPAYGSARWNYLQNQDNREKIIFWLSLAILIFTQLKSCDDDVTKERQERNFASVLSKRDSTNRHRIDSLSQGFIDSIKKGNQQFQDSLKSNNTNTIQLLAKYGYKVDSANKVLVKQIDTSMGKNIPSLYLYSEDARIPFRFTGDSLILPLGLINRGNSVAFDVHLNLFFLVRTIYGFSNIGKHSVFGLQTVNIGIDDYKVKEQDITFRPWVTKDTVFMGVKADWKSANGHTYKYSHMAAIILKNGIVAEYDLERNQDLVDYLKKVNYHN